MKVPPIKLSEYTKNDFFLSDFDSLREFLGDHLSGQNSEVLPAHIKSVDSWKKHYDSKECTTYREKSRPPKRIKLEAFKERKTLQSLCELASQTEVSKIHPSLFSGRCGQDKLDEILKNSEKRNSQRAEDIKRAREAIGYYVASAYVTQKNPKIDDKFKEPSGDERNAFKVFWTFVDYVRESGSLPDGDKLHEKLATNSSINKEDTVKEARLLGFLLPQR